MLNFYKRRLVFSDNRMNIYSLVQANNFSEEYKNTDICLQEEIDKSKDTFAMCENLKLLAEVSCSDRMDVHNSYYPESNNSNFSLNADIGKLQSEIPLDDKYLTSFDCDSSRIVYDKNIFYNSEKENDTETSSIFEIEEDLQEDKCTEIASSYQSHKVDSPIFEQIDIPNSEFNQLQTENSSEENGFPAMFTESSKFLKSEISMSQNLMPEKNAQIDTFVKQREMPKCDISLKQKYCFEKSFQDNSHIKEENHLQIEGEFKDIKVIDSNETRNDLAESIYTQMRRELTDDVQCNYLENEGLLEIITEVFEFLHEKQTNASCTEENILFAASKLGTEEKYSESPCVKSIQILQFFLTCFEKDLLAKENEAHHLKLYFETNAKELIESCNFKNSEGDDCNQFRMEMVHRCDKLLADMKEDRNECKMHSENIRNIQNFLQNNCNFINNQES